MSGAAESSKHSPLLARVSGALAHSAAAQSLPGALRIEVLFSLPRQARDLYPHAHVDARDIGRTAKAHAVEAYVEQIFMTASYIEDGEHGDASAGASGGGVGSSSSSINGASPSKGAPQRNQGTLVYALECFLYTLPKQQAALLYVSKLDSSGWGPKLPPKHLLPYLRARRSPPGIAAPSSQQSSTSSATLRLNGSPARPHPASSSSSSSQPLEASTSITRVITEAFLLHFASLDHWRADSRLPRVRHLSLHILARAQGAYLFPSSNENKRKHILSDGGLIKWWRAVVTSVVCRVRRLPIEQRLDAEPYYVVPGYDRLESHVLLPIPPTPDRERVHRVQPGSQLPLGTEALAEACWVYGHPYSRSGASLPGEKPLPPLPLHGPHFGGTEERNPSALPPGDQIVDRSAIATLLPHFPDDPKSRFISELARDAHEHVGNPLVSTLPLKRSALREPEGSAAPSPKHLKDDDTDADSSATPPPGSGAVTPRRRGKRGRSAAPSGSPSPIKLTSAQRQLIKERNALDAITVDEFWQRMAFRQECCSGNAVGVFVALFTQMTDVDSTGPNGADADSLSKHALDTSVASDEHGGRRVRGLPGQPLSLPHNMLQDIIFKRLMIDACDWSKRDQSVELTRNFESAIGHAIQRKGNIKESLGSERAEREQALDDAGLLGRDVIWSQVEMHGPTTAELDAAERRWKADGGEKARQEQAAADAKATALQPAGAGVGAGVGASANGALTLSAPVNTLTVKRKKKV